MVMTGREVRDGGERGKKNKRHVKHEGEMDEHTMKRYREFHAQHIKVFRNAGDK